MVFICKQENSQQSQNRQSAQISLSVSESGEAGAVKA